MADSTTPNVGLGMFNHANTHTQQTTHQQFDAGDDGDEESTIIFQGPVSDETDEEDD